MTRNPDLSAVASDPTWFPQALDPSRGLVACGKISRDNLSAEPFLDQRMDRSVTARATLPFAQLAAAAPGSPHAAFIFHTAFCCSTLMAKALDVDGVVLSLKEPNLLMDVSNVVRMAGGSDDARRTAAAAVKLLSRRHHADEHILIKPTNTANNLAPMIVATGAPVILLYGDLRAFLVSVLKKGEPCKAFIRKQYTIFALDREGVAAIPERQALGLTDLQIAALVWRHQMELFTRILAQAGANVASLYFRDLLKDPARVLTAAARHCSLSLGAADIEKNVASVFSKNSKFEDQEYTPAERSRDEKSLEEMHRQELDMIEGWARQLKLQTELSERLPKPLLSQ